jgi:hypothetical protein
VDKIIARELERSFVAHQAIVQAIVALNFNESNKALDILLGALSDYNFELGKENANGNRAIA